MIDSVHAVKAIVCLGNPGEECRFTRHNAGWLVGDYLCARLAQDAAPAVWQPQNGRLWWLTLGGSSAVLLKPKTYMNRSGLAVSELLRHFRLSPQEMLVVSDDLDLPEGRLRLRTGGSAGGHRGLASIIQCLQSADFPRLRVGIGRPEPGSGMSIVDYVLAPWVAAREMERCGGIFANAAAAVCGALGTSLATAMNSVNSGCGGRVNAKNNSEKQQ